MGSCVSSPSAQQLPKKVETQTTNKRTQKVANTSKPSVTKPQKVHTVGSTSKSAPQGKKLSEATNTSNQDEDPREAARKAAEVRYEQQMTKQGALGKKLEEERKKTHSTFLKEQADAADKKTTPLVYD